MIKRKFDVEWDYKEDKPLFHVYGPTNLTDPEIICIDKLAGLIFEGYFVWFSESKNDCNVGCGIRICRNTNTIASATGEDKVAAFKNALALLEKKVSNNDI